MTPLPKEWKLEFSRWLAWERPRLDADPSAQRGVAVCLWVWFGDPWHWCFVLVLGRPVWFAFAVVLMFFCVIFGLHGELDPLVFVRSLAFRFGFGNLLEHIIVI